MSNWQEKATELRRALPEQYVEPLDAVIAELEQQVHDLRADCASYECTIDLEMAKYTTLVDGLWDLLHTWEEQRKVVGHADALRALLTEQEVSDE